MVKVGSGIYRSRVIDTPEEGTLPTKNRVREAMMSALGNDLTGAVVLDLFAGSGALGIEALSRGAKKAIFVDASPKAAKIVQSNLAKLRETRAQVLTLDYQAALRRFLEPFDIVFLDPPYAMKEAYSHSLGYLSSHDLLSENAAVVVEYEGELELDTSYFPFRRDYTYGKTKVLLLRR
ncbi:MAG: 16S rRNA (guanine(966)-N(2))-methyltransferase RsmD [Bacilli bacterium]|nr:16S rRNA (guanine(966)-N(2))-methyltransferase RsmD [Bacilli bacterium]